MKRNRWVGAAVVLVTTAVYAWAARDLGVSFDRLVTGWDVLVRAAAVAATPDWSYLPRVLDGLRESLQIAILATSVASVAALPLALLAMEGQTFRTPLSPVCKTVLGAIRTFPEILFAILFMRVVGPGAYAGVLALSLYSIGFMGKFYAEIMEETPTGPLEALSATGTTRLAILRHAVLPQALPSLLSLILYRLELNVRVATVLGIVGAGGVGHQLIMSVSQRLWDRVILVILAVLVAVTLIDAVSGWVRRRLT